MKTVSLKPLNRRVQVKTEAPILKVLLAEELDVLMACGGRGRCATCHIRVTDGMDKLTPPTDREIRTLNRLSGGGPMSRLACQARVLGEGVEVQVPKGMYITSLKDLDQFIGMRAETDILHPVTGAILIEEGKIITRSSVRELKNVDFEIDGIQGKEVP